MILTAVEAMPFAAVLAVERPPADRDRVLRLSDASPVALQHQHIRIVQGNGVRDVEDALRAYPAPFACGVSLFSNGRRVFRAAGDAAAAASGRRAAGGGGGQNAPPSPPPLQHRRHDGFDADAKLSVTFLGDQDEVEFKDSTATFVPVADLLRDCTTYADVRRCMAPVARLRGHVVLYMMMGDLAAVAGSIVEVVQTWVAPRDPEHVHRDLVDLLTGNQTGENASRECFIMTSGGTRATVDNATFVNHIFGQVMVPEETSHTIVYPLPPGEHVIRAEVIDAPKHGNAVTVDASHKTYVAVRTVGPVPPQRIVILTAPQTPTAANQLPDRAVEYWTQFCDATAVTERSDVAHKAAAMAAAWHGIRSGAAAKERSPARLVALVAACVDITMEGAGDDHPVHRVLCRAVRDHIWPYIEAYVGVARGKAGKPPVLGRSRSAAFAE